MLPTPPPRLLSGIMRLDAALGGGLPFGAITEWGVPIGEGGRRVVAEFLARATDRSLWCLWVRHAASDLQIFPPAWAAVGVDLEHIRFAYCRKPLDELRPLLADSFFRVVVLDAPERLTRDDLAYLSRQARALQRIVLVLRDAPLTSERGNVWAKLRVNCRRETFLEERYRIEIIRGGMPQSIAFALERCDADFSREKPESREGEAAHAGCEKSAHCER